MSRTGGETLRPADRLRSSRDFARCYRRGRKIRGRGISLYLVRDETRVAAGRGPRLGVTASRKVGNSVVRHRLKRWIRETFRRSPLRAALPGADLVFHLDRRARDFDPAGFRAEIERLMREVADPGPADPRRGP